MMTSSIWAGRVANLQTLRETRHYVQPALEQRRAVASRTRLRSFGIAALFSAVFAIFGWAAGIRPLSDNSFLWHLRAGQWILDHGIPHRDPFSYTAAGTHWVAQSWLAEAAYAALDRTVGPFGIRLLGAIVGGLIALLTYRLALRLVLDRVLGALIALAALAGIVTLWSERPLLIGVLLFLTLVWIVEVPESFVSRHALVTLPALMWLWVNVHGTFVLGFVYLALHLLGRGVDGASPFAPGVERRLLLAGVIALGVVFINPYGVDLVTFPAHLVARSGALTYIVEWRSPDLHKPSGIAFALWVVVYVVALARGRHRVSPRDLIVTLPFVLLALWALRNVALAPFVALPVVARACSRTEESPDQPRRTVSWVAAGAIAALFVGISIQALDQPNFRFASQPVAAMRFVATHGLLGKRILNNDPAGGYIILEYYPEQRVFIDDRFDMYPRRVISDYIAIAKGQPEWQELLRRYDIEVVVWPRSTPLAALLDGSDGWTRVQRDQRDAVWTRTAPHS
jgi:hypothetical protein